MANTAICTYYFPFCKFCSKYDSRCPRNHSRFTHNTFNFIRSLKIPFDTSLSLLSCRYLDGNKNAIGKKHTTYWLGLKNRAQLLKGWRTLSNWKMTIQRISVNNKTYCQAPVVWSLDCAIHWINLYPTDNAVRFPITYPLDGDLSVG